MRKLPKFPHEDDFKTGEQPCDNFTPEKGFYGINVHQCYKCRDETTVSFCENCHRDHHENGYETCKRSNPMTQGENG